MTSLVDGPADGTAAARARLDADLSPSRSAKDAAGELDRWLAGTAAARSGAGLRVRAGLAYGPGARQRLDVYDDPRRPSPPSGRPVAVFIHGGFWQEGSIDGAGFAAPVFAAAGWLFIAVGYTLAPQAPLGAIIDEIRAAWAMIGREAAAWGGDPARIVVAGHSAGAHLAACLACPVPGGGTIAAAASPSPAALAVSRPPAPPAALALISGVFDLVPIAGSVVNDAVRMTVDEAARWSPVRYRPAAVPVHLVCGADETGEFLRQSRLLAEHWRDRAPISTEWPPGRDHFDIVAAALHPDRAPFAAVGHATSAARPTGCRMVAEDAGPCQETPCPAPKREAN